jgi:signal transduction histidine kinase
MEADGALFARIAQNALTRYASALLGTTFVLLTGLALRSFLGGYVIYVALLAAVAFSAWYCGVGPAISAVALGLLGVQYWFRTPANFLPSSDATPYAYGLAFLLTSGVIVAMGETRRRHNQVLQAAQGELEDRVKERTRELAAANEGLRELSGRLLQSQDDERRRIARELHDSVGQLLAGLSMNLSAVRTDIDQLIRTANALTDSEDLVKEMTREVRTMSYLLHPPLLDEAGLLSALRWYVEGFADRSKIKVDLRAPESFERVSRELEITVFRVVQECLTNIHRHSGSPSATIRVTRSMGEVRVEVEDRGKGLSVEKQFEIASGGTPGVGIRGMRERVRQLGGSLDIKSGGDGTTVVASFPISNALAPPSEAAQPLPTTASAGGPGSPRAAPRG